MTRKLRWAWVLAAGGAAALILALATPVGPWALARLAARVLESRGWRLAVGEHLGSLGGGFSLRRVELCSGDGSLVLDIARLEMDLRAYRLEVLRPRLVFRSSESGESPHQNAAGGGVELPTAHLPELVLREGSLDLQLGALHLGGEGVSLRYRPAGGGRGGLDLSVEKAHLRADSLEVEGRLFARAQMRPQRVLVDSLRLAVAMDTLEALLNARGQLELSASLPLDMQLSTRIHSAGKILGAHGEIALRGALRPIDLSAGLEGALDHTLFKHVELAARARIDTRKLEIDSLRLAALGGVLRLAGSYAPAGDSLRVRAALRQLDLAQVPGSFTAGRVDLDLEGALDLRRERGAVSVRVKARRLDFLGAPFDARLNLSYRPDHSLEARLRSRVLDVQLAGAAAAREKYDLQVRGEARPAALVDLDFAPVRLRGRLRPGRLQLHLHTAHLPAPFGRFGSTEAELSLREGGRLHLDATVEEDLLRLQASVDLAQQHLDSLRLHLGPLELERLVAGARGLVQGQVQASGALRPGALRASGEFTATGPGYRNWRAEPLVLRLDYGNGRAAGILESRSLKARVHSDTAGAWRGRVEFKGPLLRGVSEGVGAAADEVALVGTLEGGGRLDALAHTALRLDLGQLELRWKGWELRADSTLELRYAKRKIDFERVHLHTPLGPLRLEGSAAAERLALRAEWPALDLNALDPQWGGRGEATLEVGGTLGRPQAAGRADLRQVRLDTLAWGRVGVEFALDDTAALALRLWRQQRLEAEVRARMPAAPLLEGLRATSAGRLSVAFRAEQMDISTPLSYMLRHPVRGKLELESTLSVPVALLAEPLAWRGLEGGVEIGELWVETVVGKDSLHLRMPAGGKIALRQDHVTIENLHLESERYDRDVQSYVPAGRLQLGGSLHADTPSRIALDIEDLDLGLLGAPGGRGRLSARLEGTSKEPRLELELGAATPDFGSVQGHLEGDNAGGRLQLHWTTPLGDSLRVSGELPWDVQRGLLFAAQGRLDIHSQGIDLAAFADQLVRLDDVGGRVRGELRLEDFSRAMRLEGRLEFEEPYFALPGIEPVYTLPSGALVFGEHRQVELEGFSETGEDKKNRLALSGHLDLRDLADPGFELELRARDLPLRSGDSFKVPDLDLDLQLEGHLARSRLSGSIGLQGVRSRPELIDFNAPPVPPPPAVPNRFLEHLGLDVFVDLRNAEVNSDIAKLELAGNFHAGGTFYKPIFQGNIDAGEGQIFFLNNTFELQKAHVDLDHLVPTQSLLEVAYDPLKTLDPQLDIEARAKVVPVDDPETPYEITLKVQGPASEAAPEFSSEPLLDFYGIFSLLLFGSPSSSDFKALGTTAAGQLLGGQVERIGLDEFSVLSSGTVLGTVGEPTIRLGRYFKELPLPIWVRYEAALREMSSGEVSVEHRIKTLLRITGSALSKYDIYGVGVGLKKDF